MDQRQLVERAQRGDHDAFAVLARALVPRLDASARLILRDPELARDAVQEGFIAAWRNLPTLREPEAFEAWLRRLVVRACFDALRRRGRRPMEIALDPDFDPPGTDGPDATLPDRELVDAALRGLRPEWRAVIVLHYHLGMPLPEVASVLGIPIGTAKSRHHRSLDALRRLLGAEFEPSGPARGGAPAA